MILNGKENKEASAICFEIRIPKKKNKELLRRVPSKIEGSNFIMEKTENNFWFVNISKSPSNGATVVLIWYLAYNWCVKGGFSACSL